MSPKIDKYSAGIRINRTEQGAQRVVETDYKKCRSELLQVFRHETHPQFFARADHKDGNEQNNEVAPEAEKIREPARGTHALLIWRLHSA